MTGFFDRRRQTAAARDAAEAIYKAAVARARDPIFYARYAVPDSLDGRFDMISLHVFLVLHRLKQEDDRTKALAQKLFDTMFADMDESLRELGVGDLAVGRRVKTMAQALYGRIAAYQAALDSDDDGDLAAALRRNLYRGDITPPATAVAAVAAYTRAQAMHLAGIGFAELVAGGQIFAPLDPDAGAREMS
jgi:cytochrome b pre-mRNA-processing protein 3